MLIFTGSFFFLSENGKHFAFPIWHMKPIMWFFFLQIFTSWINKIPHAILFFNADKKINKKVKYHWLFPYSADNFFIHFWRLHNSIKKSNIIPTFVLQGASSIIKTLTILLLRVFPFFLSWTFHWHPCQSHVVLHVMSHDSFQLNMLLTSLWYLLISSYLNQHGALKKLLAWQVELSFCDNSFDILQPKLSCRLKMFGKTRLKTSLFIHSELKNWNYIFPSKE